MTAGGEMAFGLLETLVKPALLFGIQPDWFAWGLQTVAMMVFAWAGFAWFQLTRRGFADVL